MSHVSTFVRYQLPAILWGLLIFALSSIPSDRFPNYPFLSQDKILHMGAFGVFAFLVLLALRHQTASPFLSRNVEGVTLTFIFLYGALDELHQSFVPGRTPDWGDLLADLIGGLVAIVVFRAVLHWRKRRALR